MIYKLADISDALLRFRQYGLPQGNSTGWVAVDEHYRPEKKYFTIVTGIPGHGKTQFLNALLINLSKLHGWRHATFSPESFPIESHFNEFAQIYCGAGIKYIKDKDYNDAEDWIDDKFHFIYPKDSERSIDDILGYVKDCIDSFGCDTFTIDPWNELDHRRLPTLNETEYTSQVLSKIRAFCRENDVHGFLVAHPTKMRIDDATGIARVPTPYDISGSAHFFNKADYCLTIHRHDMEKNEPWLYIQKMKFKNFGKLGRVPLFYNYKSGRISDSEEYFVLP